MRLSTFCAKLVCAALLYLSANSNTVSQQGRALGFVLEKQSRSPAFLDGIPALERLKAEGKLEQTLGEPVTSWGSLGRITKALRKVKDGEDLHLVSLGGSVSACHGVEDRHDCWLHVIHRWMQKELGPTVYLDEKAIPASTSSLTSQCISNLVGANADIVLIEFTINDNNGHNDFRGSQWMDNSLRRGYERLVRKLLRYPNSPAVIVVHYWSAAWSEITSGSKSFWFTPEDEIDVIAKYYSLPVVSFRNTFYHAILSEADGFRSADILKDSSHPNVQGSQYLAYTVVSYLETILVNLPKANVEPKIPPLPPPMLEGNDGLMRTACNRGGQLESMMIEARGWHWRGGEKAGWCASTPGAMLDISTGTEVYNRTVITLGYLQSHKDMGECQVSCLQGCTCQSLTIEAHTHERVSQQQLAHLEVTGEGPFECSLKLLISDRTSSQGHNFEILSINVGELELQSQDVTYLTQDVSE